MSTGLMWTLVGVALLAVGVGVEGAKEGGCSGGAAGFFGTLALSALCIAGFRHGCGGKGVEGAETAAGVAPAVPGKAATAAGKAGPGKAGQGATKEDKLRAFALAEAPAAWETYQTLAAEAELQERRMETLREELSEFGRNPEGDDDFRELSRQLQDMRVMRDNVVSRLEAAYIAARKCEATPGRQDLDELRRKALQDGIQEAESASWRFRQMREAKQ